MQTARNFLLVGLWAQNCKGGGKCRLVKIVYWLDCGGRIVRWEGSADCKKFFTGRIVGAEL